MDKWTQKDIDKVRVGGNNQFRDFLESHSEYNAEWTIEEKYNSQVGIFSLRHLQDHLTFLIKN